MNILINWILVTYSLYLLITSVQKLFRKTSDLTSYVILIIIVFNSIPVLLDIIIGKPPYKLFPWYVGFDIAANNHEVNMVYSIYVLFTLFILHINTLVKNKNSEEDMIVNSSKSFTGKRLLFISALPIVFFVMAGIISQNPLNMFSYMTNYARGFDNIFIRLSTFMELLGIFTFTVWFFEKNREKKSLILIFVYYLLIAWINGKRYIVVTQLILFIFFFLNIGLLNVKKPKFNFKWIVLGLSILFFYFFYFIELKTIGDLSLDYLYLTYRIDFGRDDVTKFVLYKELIQDTSILEYRGQTLISTLFFFIPRRIWGNKPYPHYRYLTGALFNENILNIPSGMTPSIFETSIANLGIVGGFIFTPFVLIVLLRFSAKSKSISRKGLYLLLLTALLTQSLDSIILVLLLLPISSMTKRLKQEL